MIKHRWNTYYFLVTLALFSLLTIPFVASAEITVTNGTTSRTSASLTVPYTTSGTPSRDITLYAWFGEYNAPLSQWNRNSFKMVTIKAGDSVPKNFNVQFEFANLGLVAGKKYAYRLTNQTVEEGAFFFATPGTSFDRCFTTTEGEIPCESPGTPPPPKEMSITVNKGQITATTAVFTLTFSGTADKDYGFNIAYKKDGSLPTASGLCLLEASTQFFKSTGSKTCIITATGLTPETNYTYYLESNPTIPKLSESIKGVFTTLKGTSTPPPTATDKKLTLKLDSVEASDTTVTINGSLLSTLDEPVPDGLLKIYYGLLPDALDQAKDVYVGNVTRPGVQFSTIVISGLTAKTKYYYDFEEMATGTNFGVKTFTTSTPGNQAIAAVPGPSDPAKATVDFSDDATTTTKVDAECGSAINKPVPVYSMIDKGSLCSKGTPSEILGEISGPWSWTCVGSGGGSTSSCSLSSTSGTIKSSNYLKNPLAPGLDSFPKIFAAVYNGIVLPVAVPFIAMMIMYSGFLFVVARKSGSTDGITKAKTTFQWTIVGALLLLGGFVIANALQGTLCQLLSNCPPTQQIP